MRRRAALIAALAWSLAGCSPEAPVLDAGAVRQGIYRNDYLNLTLPLPLGWSVEKPPRADWFLDRFTQLLAAGDRLEPGPKTLAGRRHFLLRVHSEHAFLELAAAEIGTQPDLHTGADCLKRVGALLDAGGRPYRITRKPHPVKLGGLDFEAMSFSVQLTDGELQQEVFAAVRWGYAVVFVAAAPGAEGLKQAQAALTKARFAAKL